MKKTKDRPVFGLSKGEKFVLGGLIGYMALIVLGYIAAISFVVWVIFQLLEHIGAI